MCPHQSLSEAGGESVSEGVGPQVITDLVAVGAGFVAGHQLGGGLSPSCEHGWQ